MPERARCAPASTLTNPCPEIAAEKRLELLYPAFYPGSGCHGRLGCSLNLACSSNGFFSPGFATLGAKKFEVARTPAHGPKSSEHAGFPCVCPPNHGFGFLTKLPSSSNFFAGEMHVGGEKFASSEHGAD